MVALHLIQTLTAAAYITAGISLGFGFVRARPQLRRAGVVIAAIAAIAHAAVLWLTLSVAEGWDVNFLNTFSLAAWLVAVLLLISTLRHGLLEAGIVVFPGTAIAVILAELIPVNPLVLSEPSIELELHVFSSLLAYCLLSLAALTALMLAVQDKLLRQPQRIRQLEMLPPLNVLETLMFRQVAAGLFVLTVSLITGFLFVENLLAQHLVHKTVLTLLSWLLFSMLLFGRWRYGLRGRQAIYFTLTAMSVLLLGYFGSKLVLEILLDRSWSASGPTAAATAALFSLDRS
ncbi:MAG: cytochrome c biogenesis protein CcsA [Pseudomonadota bacterium]